MYLMGVKIKCFTGFLEGGRRREERMGVVIVFTLFMIISETTIVVLGKFCKSHIL